MSPEFPFVVDADAWRSLLRRGTPAEEMESLRTCTRTSRPLGTPRFVEKLERSLERILKRKKPGPAAQAQAHKVRGKRRR